MWLVVVMWGIRAWFTWYSDIMVLTPLGRLLMMVILVSYILGLRGRRIRCLPVCEASQLMWLVSGYLRGLVLCRVTVNLWWVRLELAILG